jgi:hypothetical protein
LTIIILLLFAFGTAIAIGGCERSRVVIVEDHPEYRAPSPGPPPWAPAHGHRAKHKYYYYPATFVYFDTGRSLYFYFPGDQWRVSASLPVTIRINVTEYVVLEMDDDKPYKFHSEVTKRYPPGQQKKLDKENDKDKDKGKGKGKGQRD